MRLPFVFGDVTIQDNQYNRLPARWIKNQPPNPNRIASILAIVIILHKPYYDK